MSTGTLFQKEKDQQLQFLIDNIYFNKYKIDCEDNLQMEFIITPECNLKCTYCYLNNYGDALYPKEIRDHNKIIENMKIMFKLLKSKGYRLKQLALFSGEIWASKFGLDILDIVYEEFSKYKYAQNIMIPSNMTFLNSEEATNHIQSLLDKFKKIDVHIYFSASIDGPLLEDYTRPFKDNNKIHTDNFYQKVIDFCDKNHFKYHPMVAAVSVNRWKENYKWFREVAKSEPMMLEVRNDDWTKESIQEYLDFLDYLIEYNSQNDPEKLYDYLYSERRLASKTYTPLDLTNWGNRVACSIQHALCIRLGDLAIVPCHRLSYKQLVYGWIDGEGKITANDPDLASYILQLNPQCGMPTCDKCPYSALCVKGCLGAQYESSHDLAMPCLSVCQLEKSKINHLINRYIEIGFLDYLDKYHKDLPQISDLLYNISILIKDINK